ncbi:hypothetical protein OH77DRAFT_109701 [Trametes cingulata]|nr:hypothetical protein OH77DRAFT_109701 [Trametes cingulata]
MCPRKLAASSSRMRSHGARFWEWMSWEWMSVQPDMHRVIQYSSALPGSREIGSGELLRPPHHPRERIPSCEKPVRAVNQRTMRTPLGSRMAVEAVSCTTAFPSGRRPAGILPTNCSSDAPTFIVTGHQVISCMHRVWLTWTCFRPIRPRDAADFCIPHDSLKGSA